jgi:hypothetical protein
VCLLHGDHSMPRSNLNKANVGIGSMQSDDWPAIQKIYSEGIANGNATFETETPEWTEWDQAHRQDCRLVARDSQRILGWAALSPVSSRRVYSGVAEVSVYVEPARVVAELAGRFFNPWSSSRSVLGYGRCRPESFLRMFPVFHCTSPVDFAKSGCGRNSANDAVFGGMFFCLNAEVRVWVFSAEFARRGPHAAGIFLDGTQ